MQNCFVFPVELVGLATSVIFVSCYGFLCRHLDLEKEVKKLKDEFQSCSREQVL